MLCGHLASDATELDDRAAIAAWRALCAAFLPAGSDRCRRARAAIPVSRSGDAHVHASRDARQAFATLVTSWLTSTELGHNRLRRRYWLPICPCAHGRAVIVRTLRAASTSAIMCDMSSWSRLPPLAPWSMFTPAAWLAEVRSACLSTAVGTLHALLPLRTHRFFRPFGVREVPSHSGR